MCRELVERPFRGFIKVESWSDLCLAPGDSAGVVSAEEWMGESGRKSRNLGLLLAVCLVAGVELESVWSCVVRVSAAVEDTVLTMEGGGEGVVEEREGVGGEAEIAVMVVMLTALREGLASASVSGVSHTSPLAFIVSL